MSTVPRKGAPPARGTSRPGGEFHRGPPGAAVPLRGGAPSRSHGAAVPPSRSPHGAGGTAKGANPPRLFLSVGNLGDTAAPPAPPSGDHHHRSPQRMGIFFPEISTKDATSSRLMSTVPRKGAPPARGTSRPGGVFHRGPPRRGRPPSRVTPSRPPSRGHTFAAPFAGSHLRGPPARDDALLGGASTKPYHRAGVSNTTRTHGSSLGIVSRNTRVRGG